MNGIRKNVVWTVDFDPCDAPFAHGAELTLEEIEAGLRFQAFVPGMVIKNKVSGTIGEIRVVRGRLKLIKKINEVEDE